MSQERKKDFFITAAMFIAMSVVITVFFVVPRANNPVGEGQQAEQRMFDMVDAAMVDTSVPEPATINRTSDTPMLLAQASGTEGGEVRGAPLSGAGAAPAPPADGGGMDTTGMEPIRVIPQESWDMLEKLEGKSANPEDLYNFSKTKDGKYLKVSFGALGGYKYEIPDPEDLRKAEDQKAVLGDQIPEELKKIDDADVVVVGFMVPIEVTREGNVKSFALTQNQAFCCFGVPPGMNEWIMVRMEEGKTADFTLDLPIAAFGKIEVGEEIEDGYIMSVYRMSAGEVIDAQELIRRAQG